MFRSTGSFDRLLDKATSQLLLETDWDSILQICDQIRQGDVPVKYAMPAIKRRVSEKNPHVAMFALQVLESVVKNCGQLVHDELATKQTMEEFKELCKYSDPVKSRLLGLIQAWSQAFRHEPKYRVVQDTYQIMKMEGFTFPEFKESDAMFSAEKVWQAPEWVDAEECHRCRVMFSMTTRKHHCRACGQIFCSKCSSRASTIPKYGIEREVRVCEPCYEQLNKKDPNAKPAEGELPPEYLASSLAQQPQVPPKRDETLSQEEEELQLALALSQSEAEEKERQRQKAAMSAYTRSGSPVVASSSSPANTLYTPTTVSSAPPAEEHDPELARYLNRQYWERKQEEGVVVPTTRRSPTPSAPEPSPAAATNPVAVEGHVSPIKVAEQYQNGETEENNEQFLRTLNNAISTFANRMKSNHARGRSITTDTAVQSLFQAISNMHPQLLQLLNELDEKRLHYESLQDKLAQIRDAREALNALREDHREKLQRAAQEAEHQRQLQLAQKLHIMRQKKQEYLEMQRQLALRRLQDQERERQMRLEQQKQTIQMRAHMPAFSLQYASGVPQPGPGGVYQAPPQGPPGSLKQAFSPPSSLEGSPMHGTAYPGSLPPGQGGVAPPYTTAPAPFNPTQPQTTDANYGGQYMYPAGVGGPQPGGPNPQGPYPYQQQPQQYQEAVSQPQSLPAAPAPGVLSYPSASVGYAPYGMQGMGVALPGQEQVQGQQGGFPQGQAPPAQPGYQQPTYQPAPQQPLAAPGPASVAQLISFD
ncbi:hepatocyte growth factor-regulated tyrosine kinase substrate isoform X2 [Lethenteron reissneri]|uniref:hepatocyte growth factor-regulated tyrosine kinase substrate isoform X2 n=1 Tax=Lethenteron reissneri TaxID=7753 RepID=UPI002AB7BF37|nr:hepatocyte growth factor-regulated tyrosine kinase substrate isoform X2 [Lethenteron reissneri]